MRFLKPMTNQVFTITSAAVWPSVEFQTDAAGAHTWTWTIAWGKFKKSGTATTAGNTWDAQSVITNFGGVLTIQAVANNMKATIAVKILGTNPTSSQAKVYLATKAGSGGFDKLLEHETKFKHFNPQQEPKKSYDNGYGMCQLTTPAPSYEQVWNWKLNIDGGLALFAVKRTEAIKYLSQSKRSYTTDQLAYEAVCRWNGGAYHVWDASAGQWVRNDNILCDSKTGNNGWKMDDPENVGKAEDDLRKRDREDYRDGKPAEGAHWGHYGICYADAILGKPVTTKPTPAAPQAVPPSRITPSGVGGPTITKQA